jgi:hypothetical protein
LAFTPGHAVTTSSITSWRGSVSLFGGAAIVDLLRGSLRSSV